MRFLEHDWPRRYLHLQHTGSPKHPPPSQYSTFHTDKNIKAILSVARSGLLRHSKEVIPHYLYIPAEDHEDYHLYQYFEETFNFIEKARK